MLTFTWVAPDSRGYNIGKILENNRISACYVESGIDATAGCAGSNPKIKIIIFFEIVFSSVL